MKAKTKKLVTFLYNNIVKVGASVSGIATVATGTLTGDISLIYTGVVAITSAISAAVKDRKFLPLMRIINILAVNVDRATNNPNKNR